MRKFYIASGVIVAVLLVAIVAGLVVAATMPPLAQAQLVTIDGSDGQGGIIDPVNVSATYTPRGRTVAQLHPGAQVTMLRREGDGVLIRTRDGTEGWVTYWFISGLTR